MWNKILGLGATAIVLVATPTVPPAGAQEPLSGVIATVNGTDITQHDLVLLSETLGAQLERIPEQVRMQVLLDVLIDQVLLSEAAKLKGVEQSGSYRQRMSYYSRQALRDAYVGTVLAEKITDTELAARYAEEIAKLPPEEEARARHILVETEEEAKAVVESARGGADFAELAKEKSTGPSAVDGGDLNYFTADRMVPEFSTVAFALEVGAISDPVKTQFGWHVIKLEDKRQKPPPTLETIRERIVLLVLRDRVKAEVQALRESATIEPVNGADAGNSPAANGGEGEGAGAAQ